MYNLNAFINLIIYILIPNKLRSLILEIKVPALLAVKL